MLELGSMQNMTGMETKRARGKCIAIALVCRRHVQRFHFCNADLLYRPASCYANGQDSLDGATA